VKPLHAVAVGLVVIAIYAKAGDYDLLADPAGWALVLVGLKVLLDRVDIPLTGLLWVAGVLALVFSAALMVPSLHEWFEDADPALGWALDVPALGFCGILCHALVAGARAAKEIGAAAWLQWTAIGFGLSVAAPVVVIGGGVEDLRGPAELVTGLSQLALFVLCLLYAGRTWAGAPVETETATESS
jgi:hypothetical protein